MTQCLIADGVPKVVIDALEVVNIDHGGTEPLGLQGLALLIQGLLEIVSVVQLGQGIVSRQEIQLTIHQQNALFLGIDVVHIAADGGAHVGNLITSFDLDITRQRAWLAH